MPANQTKLKISRGPLNKGWCPIAMISFMSRTRLYSHWQEIIPLHLSVKNHGTHNAVFASGILEGINGEKHLKVHSIHHRIQLRNSYYRVKVVFHVRNIHKRFNCINPQPIETITFLTELSNLTATCQKSNIFYWLRTNTIKTLTGIYNNCA